jgi:RNA polymerase sigma-70 factor (ECF subfamily)
MVRELRASNTHVHQEVLRELAPLVARWVRGFLGPAVDAGDAIQEALCQIAAALHRFEGGSSLATFAHRIAIRVALRGRQRELTHEALDDHPLRDEGGDPSRALEQRRISQRLYAQLDRMSERRRTALVLVDLLEMSPREAADVVGCTPEAMRNLLHHARRELRERVAGDPLLARRGIR